MVRTQFVVHRGVRKDNDDEIRQVEDLGLGCDIDTVAHPVEVPIDSHPTASIVEQRRSVVINSIIACPEVIIVTFIVGPLIELVDEAGMAATFIEAEVAKITVI